MTEKDKGELFAYGVVRAMRTLSKVASFIAGVIVFAMVMGYAHYYFFSRPATVSDVLSDTEVALLADTRQVLSLDVADHFIVQDVEQYLGLGLAEKTYYVSCNSERCRFTVTGVLNGKASVFYSWTRSPLIGTTWREYTYLSVHDGFLVGKVATKPVNYWDITLVGFIWICAILLVLIMSAGIAKSSESGRTP
jgi:hypothetical protein